MKGVDYQRCGNLALVRECKETLQRGVKEIDRVKYSELPSGSERDFSHPQSGSAHLAGDGRSCLIVPNFIYQIIEQHLRFQGTLQTARFDFIDYKTYLVVEIVQNLS